MNKVTKGKVNSMGKRKQHSKHQKCRYLHPSEASWEKEVKNIPTKRVTGRQGVPLMIEYLGKIGQAFFGMEGLFLDIFGFYYRVRENKYPKLEKHCQDSWDSLLCWGSHFHEFAEGPKATQHRISASKVCFWLGRPELVARLSISLCRHLLLVPLADFAGSGLNYFLQAWCISRRGPLFSAMFNPLCTVIVTILDPLSIHEELYIGSLVGAVAVIIGLYVVLWGKAKDLEESQTVSNPELQNNEAKNVRVLIDESSNKTSCTIDLK
ncbi:WAT1-related protein [Vitis vinifera]|uniref:WAT1-related protein n=1 Tax=Vitis vinifera TaxID=29760 RepID=A0A438DAC3_VITVI|nr:WAT1-related protein [Vitis vinifera]